MKTRKFFYTALIILVGALAVTGVADDVSNTYAEKALTRALTTFAVARTLNGVISVAQGTEVALEPGGVGVMLTPGQILDPVNDLVERFSSVMLVASSSLGLQIVLLDILSWWVLSAALIVSLVVAILLLWSPALQANKFVTAIPRVAVVLAVIRFALPVIIICTNFVFETFLETRHDAAATELSASAQTIEKISAEGEDSGRAGEQEDADSESDSFDFPGFDELASEVRESVVRMYANASDWVRSNSVSERLAGLQESANQATSHIIDLIVIFLLQTVVFPLCFLWLFVEALKAVAGRSIGAIAKTE